MATYTIDNVLTAEASFVEAQDQFTAKSAAFATAFAGWLGLPDYTGYQAQRGEFIKARDKARPGLSEKAHTNAWDRAIALIRGQFGFEIPKAASTAAVVKSESREKLDSAANVLLSEKGAPTTAQLHDAAVAKITGNKEQKAEAAIVLRAHEIAKAKAKDEAKELLAEVVSLSKTADARHLKLALEALKAALPADAEAAITIKKKAAKK